MIEAALTIWAAGFLICCAVIALLFVFASGCWFFLLLMWPFCKLGGYLERYKLPDWLKAAIVWGAILLSGVLIYRVLLGRWPN